MQTHERPRTTRSRGGFQVAEDRFAEEADQSPRLSVVACSLCLRVRRDAVWVEPEDAIRELRTWELPSPVLLEPGLCDRCSDLIQARRVH